ncbi:MAG: radical SAM protein [Clostridiales bacterium]|nr:radical SAM protein [Clostridiales bacterium]
MNISRIYYPVHTLGPGERVGIWLAGCPRSCENCISPELRESESGRQFTVDEVMGIIASIPNKPKRFTISGGEPFFQAEELSRLLCALSEIRDDIIVFSGYTLEELVAMRDPSVDMALAKCTVLIDGPYIQELNDGKGLRGSGNQRIHVFRNQERYIGLEQWPRGVQGVRFGDSFLNIGIP